MATDPTKYMTPDIYDLATYVNEVKKEHTEEANEDTLMVGIYGMMGELFSNIAQNSIVMASEFANESIPTKAKFEKNIISHALNLNIDNFNATPATMDVFLTFIEDEIIDSIGHDGTGEFTFDSDNRIYFGDFEFHTDYDIIIRRIKLNNGQYTYTAMYNLLVDGVNTSPVSDIENPYLTPPVVIEVNGTRYLFVSCKIRQVERHKIYTRVLADNTIAYKTAMFQFNNQLAAFDVDVTNRDESVHLVPIYEGLVNYNVKYQYIWYTYLDTDTIRIKFDTQIYSPRINSDVTINLYTTQGEAGNFQWNSEDYPLFFFDSEKYGYTNITCQIRPMNGESLYGTNKKSIKEIQRIIAIESLARGSVTNKKDLENYFNAIDTSQSKMFFYIKRDNSLERLYYSYIVMKDATSNIIPTNTIDLKLDPTKLILSDDAATNLIVPKGQIFKLSYSGKYATMVDMDNLDDVDFTDGFYYTIPYNLCINLEPMYAMYYISTMNVNKNLEFAYINEDCLYQYITTYINIQREYLTNSDTYNIKIAVAQNFTNDGSMIGIDPNTGEFVPEDCKVRAFLVLYDRDDKPYRWKEATVEDCNTTAKILYMNFSMTSDDVINARNDIKIDGVYAVKTNDVENFSYGFLPANTKAMIHIVTVQDEYSTNKTFTDLFKNTNVSLEELIPYIDNDWGDTWTVSNSYNVLSGIDFFYDYSEIVYSTVSASQVEDSDDSGDEDEGGSGKTPYIVHMELGDLVRPRDTTAGALNTLRTVNLEVSRKIQTQYTWTTEANKYIIDPLNNPMGYIYTVADVPVIKYDYFKTEDMVEFFCSELVRRKYYIDEALNKLDDNFGMNFKFFNTYGPSRLFTLDNYHGYVDRVNLTLRFKISLKPNYDENIIQYITDDIKTFVEDINKVDSIHMSNLVTQITKTYSESINFFEFVNFNNYGPGEQHIYSMPMPDAVITPEIININTLDDQTPDITITIV